MLAGSAILTRLEQSRKVCQFNFLTPPGMVMPVNEEQYSNAFASISVTVFGI